MLSLVAYFPVHLDRNGGAVGDFVDIPGLRRIPRPWLPQPLLDLERLFTKQFNDNGRAVAAADGALVNTFDSLEPAALAALRDGKVVPGFPPVYAIGLFNALSSSMATEKKKTPAAAGNGAPVASWLDAQPARSVVYVAFGNRSFVSPDQLQEIAAGLEASSCRFLWVVKTTIVDRDDAAELADVLGADFLERVQGRGLVIKTWVDQEAILKHPATGLFVTHSGWNSVTEAVDAGVPLLVWPRGGDQRLNAMAAVSGGVGVWMENWSWDGEDGLVSGEEIAEKVREVMADKQVRTRAARVAEEAAKAVAEGGSSYENLHRFIAQLKRT